MAASAADAIYFGGDIITMEGDSADYAEAIAERWKMREGGGRGRPQCPAPREEAAKVTVPAMLKHSCKRWENRVIG
ncbi:MAG: hypothetical protein U5K51_06455 [Flavobacteriaceae bacterium]|nr:hypothetical protein [Flavobacteriaceae bacterium]